MERLPTTLCRSCCLRVGRTLSSPAPSSTRGLATTAPLAAISPESPRYIDVPQSLQEDWLPRRFVPGRMPVPREIFPRNRPDKPSAEYLANVTPEPKQPVDTTKLSEKALYRHRLGQLRKQYLRESLVQLHKRKQAATSRMKFRSDEKQADHARLIAQAEREDVRLTSISVPASMNPNAKLDLRSAADRRHIHEEKKANVSRTQTDKTGVRLDNLHTLYMNARTFIVNEAQLKAKIAEEFADNKFNKVDAGKSGEQNMSLWDSLGAPDGIKDMVNKSTVSPRMREQDPAYEAAWERDQERMKRVAEKLSGGKI
ncbi:hypothetical protein DV735_g2967, partial [Chaetothyriales sp. CBS 134920]